MFSLRAKLRRPSRRRAEIRLAHVNRADFHPKGTNSNEAENNVDYKHPKANLYRYI
uniref:Uncharacterized protein n=1 Tax=Rhizophora mucronata TaxID=61149 RepID=A0A2P2QUG4_RHIMU